MCYPPPPSSHDSDVSSLQSSASAGLQRYMSYTAECLPPLEFNENLRQGRRRTEARGGERRAGHGDKRSSWRRVTQPNDANEDEAACFSHISLWKRDSLVHGRRRLHGCTPRHMTRVMPGRRTRTKTEKSCGLTFRGDILKRG